MDEPLDEIYLRWLYSQTGSVRIRNPRKTYWNLLRLLYKKEFIWIIPNDDNRVEDGRDLRYEFIDAEEIESVDIEWMHMGCSVLEMLIGLSRRLSFEAEGEPRVWFWHLMNNLGLSIYTDDTTISEDHINEVFDGVIWRTYEPDGYGGLFPLNRPERDQRDVELWYQLSAYIQERNL